jgi:hypothetical protein
MLFIFNEISFCIASLNNEIFRIARILQLSNGTVHFKNVNNCLYTNVYSYLETSGGISYNPYLNVAHFFDARVD